MQIDPAWQKYGKFVALLWQYIENILTGYSCFRGRPAPGRAPAILRHKSPITTAIYLKSLGLEETRGALDALADRFRTVSREKTKVVYFQQKDSPIQAKVCVQSGSGAKADVKLRRKSV
ncbi:MAG: hypothetical protein LBI88_01220 [Deltaproteobacteria bacterium]|jgi:hypothetical protein|nr:hypothetical protein [Deltaproteobacteria bacterium]